MNKIPAAVTRKAARAVMPPQLRQLADASAKRRRKAAQDGVLCCYREGKMIAEARNNEYRYGHDAVKQLAASRGVKPAYLYSLMDFALRFTKDDVREWTGRQMSNGQHMTEAHWLELGKIVSRGDQIKLL